MSYRTVFQEAEAEQIIQRSRFIAHVSPVESYEEAQAYVARIKEIYKDATHNVPAVVIGEKQELQWMSDDGEPQGTSGPPMLRMLVEKGLTNVVVVVTRYFGGVKLGTGGLVRAYSSSAKLGLDSAGICEVDDGVTLEYLFDYSYLAKINNMSQTGDFTIIATEYSDKIQMTIGCVLEKEKEVVQLFNDVTSGSCQQLSRKNEKIRKKVVDSKE
jgi:uncharacterized YigZ family protein